MALKGYRQVHGLNIDFITINTSERGGILTLGFVSGIRIAQYAIDASGSIPLGIQYNDVEFRDLSREYDPRRIREVEIPFGIVGIATYGDFETDWIHVVGNISPGDSAYVGPSGTITNSASYGGYRIGYFLSTLEIDPHRLIFAGGGYSRERMDFRTKKIIIDNDPRAIIWVLSDGFARVRISQQEMVKSQLGVK